MNGNIMLNISSSHISRFADLLWWHGAHDVTCHFKLLLFPCAYMAVKDRSLHVYWSMRINCAIHYVMSISLQSVIIVNMEAL